MLTRRRLMVSIGGALAVGPGPAGAAAPDDLARRFAAIEGRSGGRLGVAVLDLRTGAGAGYRPDERFPMCSTFKLLAAAAVLAQVDAGREALERRVAYGAADLVEYSPVTKARLGEGAMPLADLCEAALTLSDNTAGNLLLAAIGGPAGLTDYARSLGDMWTRLDRVEPDLNEARPDDPRDTTTPAAMLADLRRLVLGDALAPASRERLAGWLSANRTGGSRLRARLPAGWRVGDKTGSGDRGTANDVGILWPPAGEPILVAAFLTGTDAPAEARSATLAAVGEAVATLPLTAQAGRASARPNISRRAGSTWWRTSGERSSDCAVSGSQRSASRLPSGIQGSASSRAPA
ncbi:class A beta-lactamase [Methylobacterium nigriterrae]|uniref:class A beta-lactamase n=1 Tax=Methylobacterium nigriterrae TaxID=3127512 RepID=UPI003D667EF3